MGRQHIDREIKAAIGLVNLYKETSDKERFIRGLYLEKNGDLATLFIIDKEAFSSYYKGKIMSRDPAYFSSIESYLVNCKPGNISIISAIVGGVDKAEQKKFKKIIKELDSPIYERWRNRSGQVSPSASLLYTAREHTIDASKILTTMAMADEASYGIIERTITEHAQILHDKIAKSGGFDDKTIVEAVAYIIDNHAVYGFSEGGLISWEMRYRLTGSISIKYSYFNIETFIEIVNKAHIFREWLVRKAREVTLPYYNISKAHS